jgi:hypothetical protein
MTLRARKLRADGRETLQLYKNHRLGHLSLPEPWLETDLVYEGSSICAGPTSPRMYIWLWRQVMCNKFDARKIYYTQLIIV